MDLSVRISTSNRVLATQFRKAMDFWAEVLDMEWYDDNSSFCSIQLVDGDRIILQDTVVARSQFTDRANFQGFIAFDPNAPLTPTEMYLTAVHEIGHMLGLKHNPSAKSVMYHIDLEGPEVLDEFDIESLAKFHKLRVSNPMGAIAVSPPTIERE